MAKPGSAPPHRLFVLLACASGWLGLGGCTAPVEPAALHATGMIALGEVHAAPPRGSAPRFSAVFLPAAPPPACTTAIGDCALARTPVCAPACGSDERCVLGEGCLPRCERVCGPTCAERFDAGLLTLHGTPYDINLLPPYQLGEELRGAPYFEGRPVRVEASGATGAGFDRFDETVTATAFVTDTNLASLSTAEIFGEGPVPVRWSPGTGGVQVSVAGPQGSVSCPAEDAAGAYAISREAVRAALGGRLAPLSLAVVRRHAEVRKDLPTHGGPYPTGWLELSTTSTETASFSPCAELCHDTCVDLSTSDQHCGRCDNPCKEREVCHQSQCRACTFPDRGRCGACDDCLQVPINGACQAKNRACGQDAACTELVTCLGGCTTAECRRGCARLHPGALALYNQVLDCICAPCEKECQGALICAVRPL